MSSQDGGASRNWAVKVGVGALLIWAAGWFLDRNAAAAGMLVASQLGLGIALGALAFLAIGHVTGAGWYAAVRRVPEAFVGALPIAAALALIGLVAALPLYAWVYADQVAADPLLQHKAAWLNVPGFLIRAVVFLGLWLLFSRALLRASQRYDEQDGVAGHRRGVFLAAAFLGVLMITWTLASFDWLMSLEAHWFSTVYGMYNFSGALLSAVAAIILLAIAWERAGPLRGILRDEHLHDLGKILFGMATFWAYIWFCQYLLIWYSDIPEETVYFTRRGSTAWQGFAILVLVLMWLAPFLGLLPRAAKRNRVMMMRIAAVVLVGRWLDLHQMVVPGVDASPMGGFVWSAVALVGVLFLVGWAAWARWGSRPRVPADDPFLAESRHYHA